MNESIGNPDAAQQQVGQTASVSSPGARLAARRKELNWTVEQVASQLNLAPRQVQALEDDNFAALPGMAIARGFLRSYAKLLKMDAAPLLAMISSESIPGTSAAPQRRPLSPTPFSENRSSSIWKRQSSNQASKKIVTIGGVIVLIIAAATAYRMDWLTFQTDELTAKVSDGLARFPHGGSKSADSEAPGTVTKVIGNPAGTPAPDAGAPVSATPAIPAASAAPQAAPAESAVKPASVPETPAKPNEELVLTLREDSWIEIRRPDKTTLISRMVKAGSTETFPIDGPVTLIVGNARGVDATLRGEPLNLKSKTNVAKLKLK